MPARSTGPPLYRSGLDPNTSRTFLSGYQRRGLSRADPMFKQTAVHPTNAASEDKRQPVQPTSNQRNEEQQSADSLEDMSNTV